MVYVAVVEFDFESYLKMMAKRQPTWSDRQLRCPLYWQGHVRKYLNMLLEPRRSNKPIYDAGFKPIITPEAMGVEVTETCRKIGIELQWPPTQKLHLVALFGKELED